jgi:peptidoglycan/xylan/chitin deacetylase (PgdA/CDA1 family)
VRALLLHNVVGGVVDEIDRACERLPARRFRQHLEHLRAVYDVVPFAPGMWNAANTSTRPQLLVTFDDGFAGVHDVALPIMRELGMVATVFVLTEGGRVLAPTSLLHFERLEIAFRLTTAGRVDVRGDESVVVPVDEARDRARALKLAKQWLKHLPRHQRLAEAARLIDRLGVDERSITALAAAAPARYQKLSGAQIATLLAHGWTIGGHTRSHPSLACVEPDVLDAEIRGNAADLEQALGLTDVPFAYPYGGEAHVSDAAEAVVRRAGFCCAFTTMAGDNDEHTNPFRLRRYSLPALQAYALGRLGAFPHVPDDAAIRD